LGPEDLVGLVQQLTGPVDGDEEKNQDEDGELKAFGGPHLQLYEG
jgi:hypothetical protein